MLVTKPEKPEEWELHLPRQMLQPWDSYGLFFFGAQGAKPPMQSDLLPKAQETYKSEIHPKVGT